MYVCMYVCLSVCMYVCAYVYVYVHVHVHVYVYVYVCTVCMYVSVHDVDNYSSCICMPNLSLSSMPNLPKTSQNNAGLRLQDVTKVDSKKLSACPPCGKP